MSEFEAKGSCLCGAVSIEAKSVSTAVGACHCSMCQKWTGGPLMALDCGSNITFTPAESITRFSSSQWGERGFCSSCGSHLFYYLKPNDQYIVPVGLFTITEKLSFDHQIFIDEKPDYFSFSNQTKNMTGAEVFAGFSAEP